MAGSIPGKPDLIFVGPRVVVFMDGCFWHSCPDHGMMPKTNSNFWTSKLNRNKERDLRVTAQLQEMGWTVLRFWEHEVTADAEEVARRIMTAISRRAR